MSIQLSNNFSYLQPCIHTQVIASPLPAIQYLRVLTWRDWRLFTAFLTSFAALLWEATELHWHAAFMPYTLSVANHGKLIGASGTVGESGFRNKFYLFDNDLNLVKSIRLHNLDSCGQHALSNDGKFILNVVGILYVGFNSSSIPCVIPVYVTNPNRFASLHSPTNVSSSLA